MKKEFDYHQFLFDKLVKKGLVLPSDERIRRAIYEQVVFDKEKDQLNIGNAELADLFARADYTMTDDPHTQRALKGRKDLNCPLEKAYYGTEPVTINVAKRPLRLGGVVQAIPTHEFNRQLGVTWSNTPFIHQLRKDVLFSEARARLFWLNGIFTMLIEGGAQEKMVICDIDARVGKGVFARKKIKQHEILCVYSGVIESRSGGNRFDEYGLACDFTNHETYFNSHYGYAKCDAELIRNFGGYMQHAPDDAQLLQLGLPVNIQEIIQTSNVTTIIFEHLSQPSIAMMALCDIEEGEQLVQKYGDEYWRGKVKYGLGTGEYSVFDTNGTVVGSVKLDHSFVLLEDYDLSQAPKASRAPKTPTNMIGSFFHKVNHHGDCQKIFIFNLQRCLDNARTTLAKKNHKYIDQIARKINLKDLVKTCDEVGGMVDNSPFKTNPDLGPLCREILVYLDIFSEDLERSQRRPMFEQSIKATLNKETEFAWKVQMTKRTLWTQGAEDKLLTFKERLEQVDIICEKFARIEGGNDWCLIYSLDTFTEGNLQAAVDSIKNSGFSRKS